MSSSTISTRHENGVTIQHCEVNLEDGLHVCDKYLGINYPVKWCDEHDVVFTLIIETKRGVEVDALHELAKPLIEQIDSFAQHDELQKVTLRTVFVRRGPKSKPKPLDEYEQATADTQMKIAREDDTDSGVKMPPFEQDYGHDINLARKMADDMFKAPEVQAQAKEYVERWRAAVRRAVDKERRPWAAIHHDERRQLIVDEMNTPSNI